MDRHACLGGSLVVGGTGALGPPIDRLRHGIHHLLHHGAGHALADDRHERRRVGTNVQGLELGAEQFGNADGGIKRRIGKRAAVDQD